MMIRIFTSLFFPLLIAAQTTAPTFLSIVQKLESLPAEQRQPVIERYLNTVRVSPIIEQDSVVHFVLYGLADSVNVNGSMFRWQQSQPLTKLPCGPYSLFYRTVILPPEGRFDYTYSISGKTVTDPQNPRVVPSGFGPHSEVRMPKFVPSPYLEYRPGIAHGVIDSLAPFVIIPPPLKHYVTASRPIKVYRPAGYDTLGFLPSIYVHDGFEAIEYQRFTVILDNLIADHRIPPVLAVFIPPVDREGEYMFYKRDRFVRFLADELVPLIDGVYRTDRAPQRRAMVGISAGAHLALYAVMARPDIFGNAGAQSYPLTPELRSLTQQQHAAGHLPASLHIYMDCGRYDIVDGPFDLLAMQREYSALLSSLRIPHYYLETVDGHEWGSWRERLPGMLTFFFGRP